MASLRWLLLGSIVISLGCLCEQALLQRILGGRRETSPEDPGVRRALQFALNEYNRASNDAFSSRVSEVVRAETQVVSGMKYYLTVKIRRTVCRKGVVDLENCAFHEAPNLAKTMVCNFEVYSIPWRNYISMSKRDCA